MAYPNDVTPLDIPADGQTLLKQVTPTYTVPKGRTSTHLSTRLELILLL